MFVAPYFTSSSIIALNKVSTKLVAAHHTRYFDSRFDFLEDGFFHTRVSLGHDAAIVLLAGLQNEAARSYQCGINKL
jgi:hypothetical protein